MLNVPTRTLFAVDISGFAAVRHDVDRAILRDEMYRVVREAFDATGIGWYACYAEDRGDGVFVVLPATAPAQVVLYPLVAHLLRELLNPNRRSSQLAPLRLRVALHTGLVQQGRYGLTGEAIFHLFRLLDAPAVRKAAAHANVPLTGIVSEQLYNDVIHAGMASPPGLRPITVQMKETQTRAWIWVPQHGDAASEGKDDTGLRALLRTANTDSPGKDAVAGSRNDARRITTAARKLAHDPREAARIAAITQLGDTTTAFYRLAELAERDGDLPAAEEYFRKAAEVDYDDAAYRLANVLYRRSRGPALGAVDARQARATLRDEAEQWYLQAGQAGVPRAWQALGDLYRDSGRMEEAAHCYNRAMDSGFIPPAIPRRGDEKGNFGDLR